ncbi:MAG: hypothetical protein R3C31_14420 [Hyphomonadaceae bacterium]
MWAKSALLFALLAASTFSAPADAQQREHVRQAHQGWVQPVQYRGGGGSVQCTRPVGDAIAEVAARAGGGSIVGRARCLEQGGRPIYEIRWRMPDNQLRDFYVSGS